MSAEFPAPPAAPNPSPQPTWRRLLAPLWLGMAVFGALNLPLLLGLMWFAENQSSIVGALLFALVIAALAALSYFVLRWRRFAAGLLLGYVLMTLVSAGVCTLINTSNDELAGTGAISGLLLYPLALFIFLIVMLVVGLVEGRRREDATR